MIHQIVRQLDKAFRFDEAKAHCDIPCGIYDPIGAQIGATLTQFFAGPRIRLAFIPLPIIGIIIIIHGLLAGHPAK